jgi:hypothetical protein
MKRPLSSIVPPIAVLALGLSLALLSHSRTARADCLDFDSLKAGTVYAVGTTFADAGIDLTVQPFQWSNGTWTSGGSVRVDNQTQAGYTGLDLNLNNANLRFHLDSCVDHLTLLFGEYGGNVNIEINGDFRNTLDLKDIDGATVGGVKVAVLMLGRNKGRLELTGPIDRFALGGQELWIDHVCPDPCALACVEFESPPLGAKYTVGTSFTDSGATIALEKFQWTGGSWTTAGYAQIDNRQLAGHAGQDLWLNNINARFKFPRCVKGLSLLFGEYGGNINLEINGDFRNALNLLDLDGATVGGVTVDVTDFGNSRGRLVLAGIVQTFAIGGQELWIDHVCIDSCGLCALALTCPTDIDVVTANPAGTVVTFPPPTVNGNCPPIVVTANPPSGSNFPLGDNLVTCTATDAASNTLSCQFHVRVHPVEIDHYDTTAALFTVLLPSGASETVLLRGSMTARVGIGPDGECTDTDADGRDQAAAVLDDLTLAGSNPAAGPVRVHLQDPSTRPSNGEFEETANLLTGRLDAPPFAPLGQLDGFFDIFVEVDVAGALYHNVAPLHVNGRFSHKPPAPCESYKSQQSVPLYNAQGQPSGLQIASVILIPDAKDCLTLQCPPDVRIECGTASDPQHTGVATASSVCDPSPSITFLDSLTPGQCPAEYQIRRTWQATDACGNRASCTQTISVEDTTPPQIQCPPDVDVGLGQPTDPAATGFATATDNCNTNCAVTFADTVTPGTYPIYQTITRKWTTGDGCDNTAACTQIIRVVDAIARCIDFESLQAGTTYPVGSSFADSGVNLTVLPFQWTDGTWTSGGHVRVDNANRAGHSGLDLNLNNANLRFHLKGCVGHLTLLFGEYGGNVNLDINGDFRNTADFFNLNGAIVGGVKVAVIPLGLNRGRLELTGSIDRFAIGGQELWIDHVCPDPCAIPCIEFETQQLGSQYPVGASFADAGATLLIEKFQWSGGTWTTAGYAQIDNRQLAGHTGQDLWINNVNTRFQFQNCIKGLSLLFGEYGGNVNLDINGDFRNSPNLQDLDGATVGGVTVDVADLGGGRGRLVLTGTIQSFAIGGQEFWIDHVCTVPCGTCGLIITCPPDLDVVTDDPAGVVVTFGPPTVNGNCPPFTITADPPSGSKFPLGTNIVTCTATDAATNHVACKFIIRVHPVEIDAYPAAAALVTVRLPTGATQTALLRGPMTAHVAIGFNGECTDSDLDGRDQAPAQLVQLDLAGTSPSGPLALRLQDPNTTPSTGQFEETANLLPGRLDVPPFSVLGQAESFFDIFFEIEIGGFPLHNATALTLAGRFTQKPPAPCETYRSRQGVPLLDAQGNLTGAQVTDVLLIPDPKDCLTIACPPDLRIECGTSTDPQITGVATATSVCDLNPTLTYSDAVFPGQCAAEQRIVRTWRATDACGNVATCDQTLSVVDTTPPQIHCPPDATVGPTQPTDPAATGTATVTDNCDTTPTVSYSDAVAAGTPPVIKTITRSWTAVDDCTNSSTCNQIIQVVDQGSPCIEFEWLPAGHSYAVTESFTENGVTMTVAPFQWSNGLWTSAGHATVDNDQRAGHIGQDINLNNVNLRFLPWRCVRHLSLLFGEYGGNINLEINGDFRNKDDFIALNGATVGGATVAVANLGANKGRIELTGAINTFAIGGQELWIDHVCIDLCTQPLEITEIRRDQGRTVTIRFSYSDTKPLNFTLETCAAIGPASNWTPVNPPATITPLGGGQFEAVCVAPPGREAYFRLKGTPAP